MAVEPGPHRGAPEGEFVQIGQRLANPGDVLVHLLDVARKLLPEGERHRIHHVGPADLDDVGELGGLGRQDVTQVFEGRQEVVDDLLGGRDVHGGREGVVGRLAEIDVVVGVDGVLRPERAAGQLDGAVGDHLVGVHVGLGAAAGLPHHQREVVVEGAVRHLAGGANDQVRPCFGQQPEALRWCGRQRV